MSDLPDEVKRFITHHIDSVEQVEILLLLYQQQERTWSAEAVARELRIAPLSAGDRLEGMLRIGLLTRQTTSPEEYRYAPRDSRLEEAVSGLAEGYTRRRVTIINLIYAKPIDKIRTFSDAFRIKKDDDHG